MWCSRKKVLYHTERRIVMCVVEKKVLYHTERIDVFEKKILYHTERRIVVM